MLSYRAWTAALALLVTSTFALACTPPSTPEGEASSGTPVTGASGDLTDAKADEADEADEADVDGDPTELTLILDWVPNTNHSGIFVAAAEGYFEAAGLEVEIVQPGEVYAEQAVAGGAADFGISYQESLTLARADGVPLVSLAAIIQHNSSAFASRAGLAAGSAADYGGLRYGTFGTPFEQPTLEALMACDGADSTAIESVELVNAGFSDPLALLAEDQIDLAWIFWGWQGVQAERGGIELDVIMLDQRFDCIPDYYTPLLFADQATIDDRPETTRAFVTAVAKGYAFAIARPLEAAEILFEAAPELDRDLVIDSQAWMSPRYQDDAERWGAQRIEVWDAYSDWMAERGIIPAPIDAAAAFSNAFLP